MNPFTHVTPDLARKLLGLVGMTWDQIVSKLEANHMCLDVGNFRKVMLARVMLYANMIRRGTFLANGESIIITKTGKCIQGQHRLLAVIFANMAIDSVIVSGVEDKQNGIEMGSTCDGGAGRSIAVRLGREHAQKLCSMATPIAYMCAKRSSIGDKDVAASIIDIFAKSMELVRQMFDHHEIVTSGKVAGTLAFCHNAMPNELDDFLLALREGTGLKRGDAALVLRNNLVRVNKGGNFYDGICWTATAAMYHVQKEPMKILRTSHGGVEFWLAKQPRIVNRVKMLWGKDVSVPVGKEMR